MKTTIAAAALPAAALTLPACGATAPPPVHLLSPAAACAKYNEQTTWYEGLDNPSPAQAALFDRYLVQDGRKSSDPNLATALRIVGRSGAGEAWATGSDAPQQPIINYCDGYPS